MSDIEARIAEVLEKHRLDKLTQALGTICICGWKTNTHKAFGGRREHYAHQAAALLPLIRESQADAWGTGHDDGEKYGYQLYQYERGYVDVLRDPANPYRSNDE